MAERNNNLPTSPGLISANNYTNSNEPRTNRLFGRSHPPAENPVARGEATPRPAYNNPTPPPRNTQPVPPLSQPRNGLNAQPGIEEVLQGRLQAFSPSSLLSLLNIQKTTGRLRLRNGKFEGYIFIEKGEVYDAGLGSVSGALALFQLFGWKQGDFIFEVGVPTPARRTIEASLPVLQVRATLWLDNMNKYMPLIPSTAHRIAISNEPRSEVVIEPYQWPVLTKIVSKPLSIAQLAAELDQDLMTVTRIAADLVKMGVAVVHEPDPNDPSLAHHS